MPADPSTVGGIISSEDVEVFGPYSQDPMETENAGLEERLFGSHLGELVLLVQENKKLEVLDESLSTHMQLLKDLTQTNILSYRGVYIKDNDGKRDLVIVYLLPEGGTLHSLLFETQAQLGWSFKLRLARGAANGLKHLHDSNVLHNNVRSYNFALDSEYNCMIFDFHCAKQLQDVFVGETLACHGDPAYMSPECLSQESCCGSSDIFSLGLVLWELASRQPASVLKRNDEHHIDFDQMHSLVSSDTPHSFLELIRQCVLPERELRPAVEDIVEWLDSLMEEHSNDDEPPLPALPLLPFNNFTRATESAFPTPPSPSSSPTFSTMKCSVNSDSQSRLSTSFFQAELTPANNGSTFIRSQVKPASSTRRSSVEHTVDVMDGLIIGTRSTSEETKKQGYMLKKIKGLPYWKKRWFILDGLKFSWCHTEADAVHVGKLHHFELSHCIVEEVGSGGTSSQFLVYKDLRHFKPPPGPANGPKQNLEMRLGCANRHAAEEWMEALEAAISTPRCKVCRVAVQVFDVGFDYAEDQDRLFCSVECGRFYKAVNGRGLVVNLDVLDNTLEIAPKEPSKDVVVEYRHYDWDVPLSGATRERERERLISTLLPNSMHDWLDALKLAPFLRTFEATGYGSILHIQFAGLNAEDLDYIGIFDDKHRDKLLRAAAELRAAFYTQQSVYESEHGDISILPYKRSDDRRRRTKWRRASDSGRLSNTK